jgi:DMSO/TMAO reductase YedYZ molybdopterin-dependent catalytic subunit
MRRVLSLSRRRLILTGAAGAGGLLLPGCDRLSEAPDFRRFLQSGEILSFGAQRLLLAGQPLAREFAPRDRSPTFRTNGSTLPVDSTYQALAASGFADWRLAVDGFVQRPLRLTLADLRALPGRSQITRHDCVEGWSAIGKWTGAPLAQVLMTAGLQPSARYIVFHCADDMDSSTAGQALYYESIDLFDAFHPRPSWPTRSTTNRWKSAMARRFVCASNGNSATSTPSSSCASRRSTAFRGSARARAAIGKTRVTLGTRGDLSPGSSRPPSARSNSRVNLGRKSETNSTSIYTFSARRGTA